jgi:hypothetical protein
MTRAPTRTSYSIQVLEKSSRELLSTEATSISAKLPFCRRARLLAPATQARNPGGGGHTYREGGGGEGVGGRGGGEWGWGCQK